MVRASEGAQQPTSLRHAPPDQSNSSLTVTPPRFLRDIPLYHPQGFELVFYGDSITETWRGTDLGRPCKRPGCPEGAAIFGQHFGDRWRTGILGVAGGFSAGHRSCRGTTLALLRERCTFRPQPNVVHQGQHVPTLL